ncbi:MAG TPA: TonB family protein [Candidatus Acidoferrales bacterium]|nr:TonB family protein [Candidatus Acidoferrales bacterium]
MSDFGSLSQCIVESDSGEVRRARWLRGQALFASTCLEAAALAIVSLWPLINPSVLPSQPVLAPVPIFHSAPRANPELPRVVEQRRTVRPIPGVTMLHQPPRIPAHIATGDRGTPPPDDVFASNLPPGPGNGFGLNTNGEIARPAPVAHPNRPVKMSGGVMEALLIRRVEPDYPRIAIAMHLTGTVQLRAIIGTDGTIQNLQVVSGSPILASAAVAAVKQWRYQPTRLSGEPVEVETVILVQFQMP